MATAQKTSVGVVRIRWMVHRDLNQVLKIERASYSPDWRWPADAFEAPELNRQVNLVATLDNQVAGYIVYLCRAASIEIMNLTVSPQHRRRGIASQLLRRVLSKVKSKHGAIIETIVRESSLPVQLLLQDHGFFAQEILQDYYGELSDEDAYRMEYVA
jgi:[ribosomal protein S18]-alanine N-acetyltransferase